MGLGRLHLATALLFTVRHAQDGDGASKGE